MQLQYDLIVVGTGFASSFFLLSYLERLGPHARVLVLERGTRESPQWQRLNRRNSSLEAESLFAMRTPRKRWRFTAGFGGGSNCWWAVTIPRLLRPLHDPLPQPHGSIRLVTALGRPVPADSPQPCIH